MTYAKSVTHESGTKLGLLEWEESISYYWFVNSKNFLKSGSDEDIFFEVEDEVNPEENSLER